MEHPTTNIGVNLNIPVDRLLRWLADWTRNKEQGMTLQKYWKKIKAKHPNMTRDIFVQFLKDQQNAGALKVYHGTKVDYIVLNPASKKR